MVIKRCYCECVDICRPKDGKKLTREQALIGIKMTEIPILDSLKNRHSYVPVKVYIYQVGNSVNITIEYIAKIYGAKK